MDTLGYIDFILLGFIIFVGFRGFFSGFIREIFGFVGLILGAVFASRYAYEVGEWIKIKIYPFESTTLSTLLGFIVIFVFIWIVSSLISIFVCYLTRAVFPRYLDRLLGVLFGALKAFVALAILLHFVFRIESMRGGLLTHFQANSVIYPSMESVASKIVHTEIVKRIPKSPEELQETLKQAKDKLEETKEKVMDTLQEKSNQEKLKLQESLDLKANSNLEEKAKGEQ